MEKQSKINAIDRIQDWSNNENTYANYKIFFANGDVRSILKIKSDTNPDGKFYHKVGDVIKYKDKPIPPKMANSSNFVQGCSVVWEDKKEVNQSSSQRKNDNVQDFIIMQSSIASAANFYSQKNVEEETVILFAEKLFQKVKSKSNE